MDPLRFEPNPIGEWGCYWDPEGPIGYGKTKAKALSDLIDQCDDADGHAQDMLAGAIVAALVRREEYDRANPLGGPASMFRAMAERIEAGEAYAAVLADYGVTVGAPPTNCGGSDALRQIIASDPAGGSIGDLLTEAANALLASGGGPMADRLAAVGAAFYCVEHAEDAHATEGHARCGGQSLLREPVTPAPHDSTKPLTVNKPRAHRDHPEDFGQ